MHQIYCPVGQVFEVDCEGVTSEGLGVVPHPKTTHAGTLPSILVVVSRCTLAVNLHYQFYRKTSMGIEVITLSKREAQIVLSALRALDESARSDEPHIAHGPEFINLSKKVRDFIKK